MESFADADFVFQFFFELVHDGLYRYTANSVGGLEFEQNGRACADEFLHLLGIIHERSLPWVEDAPGGDQTSHDDAKGEIVAWFRLVGQQYESGDQRKQDCDGDEGVLIDKQIQ